MMRFIEPLSRIDWHSLRAAGRKYLWVIPCVALCGFALAFNFSGYPLLDPDEGRNAEVAREMAAGSGYVLPRLNSLPYLDKPILFFAAGAVSIKLLGPTVFAARLPSLLFTLATLALVGWFGARLLGPTAAWTAIIATTAMPFTLAYSRTVIFDSALTFFVLLAVGAFYLATEAVGRMANVPAGSHSTDKSAPDQTEVRAAPPVRRGSEGWTTLAWAAMALGVLTKGPIALALPLMIAVPFAAWRRAWRAIADPVSILLFAALIAPWLFAVSRQIPDFMHYALVTETARRLTSSELQRTGPIWYFLAILPAAALPWSLVALGAWRAIIRWRDSDGKMDGRVVYLLLWVVIPMVFFTLSQSKRPQYILPLMAPIALLVAAAWNGSLGRLPGARFAAVGTTLLGTFMLTGSGIIPSLLPASDGVARAIPDTAIILGLACILSGLLGWLAAHRRGVVLLAFSIPVAAVPIGSLDLMEAIGEDRSAAAMAEVVESVAGPEARVIGVKAFPLSLPFYLQRTVLLATVDGSELTSNYIVRHFDQYAGKATLRQLDWWRTALIECHEPTVFVIATGDREAREILSVSLDVMLETHKYAVFGPCGITSLALAAH
ncbi:MAG: glycosyltransferase family 39 protein [Gemmatimonadota bacterium]|nr:MAG: glycosyltransferase family 39 protein [Gemmatimonadota bacterium]